jgi:ribosomal protein L10
MKRSEKGIIINTVLQTFDKCNGVFVIDYQKINSSKVVLFKKQLVKLSGSIVVVKNSLLGLAAKQNENLKKISVCFQKQIALVYAFNDVFEVASAVNLFLKDVNVSFKAGLIYGDALNRIDFEKISKINSQKGLYAQVCGVLQNPIVKLIVVLDQISKIKDKVSL